MMFNKTTKLAFGVLLLAFSFASCSPERQIARKFVEEVPKHRIILIEPDYLFLANLSEEPSDDSLAIASSAFLHKVEPDTFLSEYFQALKNGLIQRGVPVSTELTYPSDTIGSVHIIDIAQMGLEEYLFEYRDEEQLDSLVYFKDFLLRGMSLNVWIDVNRLDSINAEFNTLFDAYEETDLVDGLFTMNLITGKVSYQYTMFEMRWPVVAAMGVEAGDLHAGMLFDYMMNRRINEQLEGRFKGPLLQFTYDIEKERLRIVKEPKEFQFLR